MELMSGKKLGFREKVLLVLVGVAALAALFYYCIYQSQVDKMASISSQIQKNKATLQELTSFDGKLKTLENEVDDLDKDIQLATANWFPNLKQDVIIKDLESKIKSTNLSEGSVAFKSTKEADIAEFKGTGELPTIAEALTLSFVTLMQENDAPVADTSNEADVLINKTEATPTPDPLLETETTTAFAAQAGIENTKKEKNESGFTAEVQEKLDALNSSLKNLTEAELQTELEKILAKTDAKVEKMQIEVSFHDTSYRSIMDFVTKVEKTSPNIYVTSLSFTDDTKAYVNALQAYEANKEAERVKQVNLLFKDNQQKEVANDITVVYNGVDKYSGTITLDYFAVSKIHR